MLKGRSKSFAPKAGPRAPKRKAPDDAPAPETPAKRVSTTPDRPSEPTSTTEIHQPAISAPEPEHAAVATQSAPVVETANSIPRPPKRKTQDDAPAPEPPAKRVSMTPDRPSEPPSTTEIHQPAFSDPELEHTAATIQSAPAVETTNSNVPARRPSPSTNTRPESLPAVQDTPPVEIATNNNLPAREPSPIANITSIPEAVAQDEGQVDNITIDNAPERELYAVRNPTFEPKNTTSAQSTDEEPSQAPRASPQPEIEAPVLPSIETNDTEQLRSPPPARHVSFGPPGFRYPPPENIVRIGDSEAPGTPANMGPPGGQLGAAGDVAAIVRTGEIVQMAVLNPDGTTGNIIEGPASGTEKEKKKKKVVKRKKVQASKDDGDDSRATIDMGLSKAKRQAAKRAKKKKDADKRRKEREETPSEAEEETIDPTKLTMTDLCSDLRIGKKFSLHDVIKQRVMMKKQESQRNKLRENHPELVTILDAEDEDDEARLVAATAATLSGAGPSATGKSKKAKQKEPGPQMVIVDGNIVVDETSTMIDRQREADLEREEMEEVEENEFTRVITAGTYLKREKSNSWDDISTDMFYKGLSQYGTDFQTIAKLFPHRSRRQIKLKFNTEEKRNPAKITRYLTQPKKAMDLEQFEKISGLKLQSVEAIKAEQDRLNSEYEARLAKQAEGLAAADRAKKAEIAATSEKREAAKRALRDVGDDSDIEEPSRVAGDSAKENAAPPPTTTGKGKKKGGPKKPKKNKHSHIAGGEGVIVLGTIE